MAENIEEIVLNITLPDKFTLQMWETYSEGRSKYAVGKPYPDENAARYFGARALVEAGFVKVTGWQPFIDALKGDAKVQDLTLVGAIVDEIALPLERALNRPLAVSLRLSSPTATIRINDTVLPPLLDISKPETTTSSLPGESGSSPLPNG